MVWSLRLICLRVKPGGNENKIDTVNKYLKKEEQMKSEKTLQKALKPSNKKSYNDLLDAIDICRILKIIENKDFNEELSKDISLLHAHEGSIKTSCKNIPWDYLEIAYKVPGDHTEEFNHDILLLHTELKKLIISVVKEKQKVLR